MSIAIRRSTLVVLLIVVSAAPLFGGNCSWVTTPSTMPFGTYSVFATLNDVSNTSFSFRCTPNQYANIKLTTGGAGTYTPYRRMSGSGSANYNICLDANCAQIWGDANAGTYSYDVYNSTPQNKDFTDIMYGIMPLGQDLTVGSYTDTVYATLAYSTNPGGPFTSLPPVAISVSATVSAECRIDTFNLNFGAYNPFSAVALSGSSTVKVYCTKGSAPLTVGLDNGANALGAQPRMVSGVDYLNYNPSLTATIATSTSSLTPINGGFSLTATVPVAQDVPVGNYIDTLQALVNY